MKVTSTQIDHLGIVAGIFDVSMFLQYYKGQQSVERGFRYLKDKQFRVAEVYLKKVERIEALAMIMVLTLLIYSFAEWTLRKGLKETGQSIPDQKGKPTQRPTMKRSVPHVLWHN